MNQIEKHGFLNMDLSRSFMNIFNLRRKQQFEAYRVSVIVPNYNYAHFLEQRLNSIVTQTIPPFEIIFLDDCSSDDSIKVAKKILSKTNIPYRILCNDNNKGIYQQWMKGVQESKGNLIWIAEADDYCSEYFIETVLKKFLEDKELCLSYCQSRLVDQNNNEMYKKCLVSTDSLDPEKWLNDYIQDGKVEIKTGLAYRCTIPNASAVIFKKDAFEGVEKWLNAYRFCGDLLVYCHILLKGKIGYSALSLNTFRLHEKSATHQNNKSEAYVKEIMSIKRFIGDHFAFDKNEIAKMKTFLNIDLSVDGVDCVSEMDFVRKELDNLEKNGA